MAFDSAASLLFNIGANSDDAEENIARFRALLGTDLDTLGEQFTDWADEVFGKLETVRGAFIAITAAAGAAAVAAIGMAVEAGNKFEELALTIGAASQKTGLATETLSAMHVAAHELNVPFEQVTAGIVRFERSVEAAQDPTSKQAQLLARMGFTTAEVHAAIKNFNPFLDEFAHRFSALAPGPEKVGVSMEFMGRAGAENIKFMQAWTNQAEEYRKKAHELGVEIGKNDVEAAKKYQAGIKELEAQWEGFAVTIGRKVMPVLQNVVKIISGLAEGMKSGATNVLAFTAAFTVGYTAMAVEMDKAAKAAAASDLIKSLAPAPEKVKAALQDFHSLTSELDGMKVRLADLLGPEEKLGEELNRMRDRAAAAATELIKLNDAGKLAPGVWDRESAALIQLRQAIGNWGEAMKKALGEKDMAEIQKYVDSVAAASKELSLKLDEQADATYERQVARWETEISGMRDKMAKEQTLSAENEAALEKVRLAGLARIDAAQLQAYNRELQAAQNHSTKMLEANMTAEQKLAAQYQIDVNKFSEAAAAKVAMTAKTVQQAEVIESQYGQIRQQLLNQYQLELQKLYNSQGWQGIFGNYFAQSIRGNANLMKEWAESANQSTLMVKVAIQSLKQDFQDFFNQEAQAMGQSIANALVYSKSIGQAFREGTAAALEALAARAATQAIYATAEGFMDLGNPATVPFAAPAFQAAAMFAVIAGASGLAGRAIAPSQSASGGASGGAGSTRSGSGGGSSYGSSSGTMGQGGTRVEINIQGHVIGTSGAEELCNMINQAVQGKNVKLYATQVKNLTPYQH